MPWATGRGSREGIFCGTKGVADELLRPASPRGEGRDLTTEMVRDKLTYTTRKNVATENPVPRLQRCISLERMSVDRNKRQQPEDSDSQDESQTDQGDWQLVKKRCKQADTDKGSNEERKAPQDDHPRPPKQDQGNEATCPPPAIIPKILVPVTEMK